MVGGGGGVRALGNVLARTTAIALLLAACLPASPYEGQTLDTWPVGEAYQCAQAAAACEQEFTELSRAAVDGLDARNPGHAPVAELRLHREGPGPGGVLTTRSGRCCMVAVIRLSDGRVAAIGVGYPGVGGEAMAVPWGP